MRTIYMVYDSLDVRNWGFASLDAAKRYITTYMHSAVESQLANGDIQYTVGGILWATIREEQRGW